MWEEDHSTCQDRTDGWALVTCCSIPSFQTPLGDRKEIGTRNKSMRVGEGLGRASTLLGFVAAIGHGEADVGRTQSCTQTPAGPWARQHAEEPPEDEKGQSADSGAFLLPHTVQFTLGCCSQLSEGQNPREGSESKDDAVTGDEGKW